MMCINAQGSAGWACGRCKACRINRKRDWTSRMMLEASASSAAYFVTLTYAPENLPLLPNGIPTLAPADMRNWLKRFRKAYKPRNVRYFLCGEYGSRTMLPHYHVILFFKVWEMQDERTFSHHVQATWPLGHVHIGDVTQESLSYVCDYTVKGLTRSHSYSDGRFPEFARYSQGLGKTALTSLLDVSETFPMTFHVNGKDFVMPKYLRRKAKKEYGIICTPSTPLQAEAEAVSLMLQSSGVHSPRQKTLLDTAIQIQDEIKASVSNSRSRTRSKIKSGLFDRSKHETL